MRASLAFAALGAGVMVLAAVAWLSAPPEGTGARASVAATAVATSAPSEAPDPGELSLEIQGLREALEIERRARIELADEVDLLRGQLVELSTEPALDAAPAQPPPSASSRSAVAQPPSPAIAKPVPDRRGRSAFDESALVDLGVPVEDAARLRERFEAHELDELYLRDQARREDWFRSPRYAASMRGMRDELREEMGDETYDLMLYASGRRNRVKISQVLINSAAERAGLLPGDIVLRYDGHNIFSGPELQAATTASQAGASVAVDVLREGEEQRFYLPAGPLGTRINGIRQAPDVRW